MSILADLPHLFWPTLWTSTLAMALLCGLRNSLRQVFGPHVAYLSWAAVPIVMLSTLLPARTQTLSDQQILQPLTQSPSSSIGSWTEGLSHMPATVWVLLSCVWLTGVLVSACRMVRHQRRFTRAMGQIRETSMRGVFEAEHDPGLPAAIGLFEPRIVMPPNAIQIYTPQEYTLLLAHERMHLAMKDHWVNGMSAFFQCLFWFNPILHFAAARMRRDQELSCDAHVSKRFPNLNRHYGELILKTQFAPMRAPMACQWSAFHPRKERIMQLKSKSPSPARRTLGVTLVGLSLVCVGFMAWAAQPAKIEVQRTLPANVADAARATPSLPTPVVASSVASVTAPVTPPTPKVEAQKREAERIAREAADAQRIAKEEVEIARAAAERAREEASAQAIEAEARRAADEARIEADAVRRAKVEAHALARAEIARAAADKDRMEADRVRRAARDAAVRAEAARVRAEVDRQRASDAQSAMSDAAREASARQERY